LGLEQFRLAGKTAIITGASGGLGEAIARAFAEAGAKVVVASRQLEKLERIAADIRSCGQEAMAIKTDVAKADDVQRMTERAFGEFGAIDILVNNAALGMTKNLVDTEEEEWDAILDTNLKGTYLCCKIVGSYMTKQERGKIINISSIFGIIGVSKQAAYSASKGGIIQLTRSLALEMARYKVNVNCIAPGLFFSPINIDLYKDETLYQASIRRIPLHRAAEMKELTAVAIFLASDASDYIIGETIKVDGGWSIFGNVIRL